LAASEREFVADAAKVFAQALILLEGDAKPRADGCVACSLVLSSSRNARRTRRVALTDRTTAASRRPAFRSRLMSRRLGERATFNVG
jgi:hypothetical protein